MKKLAILVLCTAINFSAFSAEKSCKKNYNRVSCEKVKGSKRSSFCWKGKLTSVKKVKACQKTIRKKS